MEDSVDKDANTAQAGMAPTSGGTPVATDAEQMAGIPPEFHSIVREHGLVLTNYCALMQGVNDAIKFLAPQLAGLSQVTHQPLGQNLQFLTLAFQDLCNALVAVHEWTPAQIQACALDVARLRALQVAQKPGIIIPS